MLLECTQEDVANLQGSCAEPASDRDSSSEKQSCPAEGDAALDTCIACAHVELQADAAQNMDIASDSKVLRET